MARMSLTSMERIMQEVGAERISDSSKFALREVLEERAIEINKKSSHIAKHSNRKTILRKDILISKD